MGPCLRRDDGGTFNFQTARHRRQFLPSPREAVGSRRAELALRGRGWGVPQQTRCQRSELIDPPPPTPPHHAQRRVEGGEITVHDFAISRRVASEVCQKIPYPPVRRRRRCRPPNPPPRPRSINSGKTPTRSPA